VQARNISADLIPPAQNLAFEIPVDNASTSGWFTSDTTQPNLITFDLEIDSVMLTLVFYEAVDVTQPCSGHSLPV